MHLHGVVVTWGVTVKLNLHLKYMFILLGFLYHVTLLVTIMPVYGYSFPKFPHLEPFDSYLLNLD